MKALVFRSKDEPLKLTDIERPVPGQGELLIHMHYAALNHMDLWIWKEQVLDRPVISGSDGTGVDISNSIYACEADNYLAIRSNLTYEFNEGITKCDPNDPQVVETGAWNFAGSEAQISFTATGSVNVDVAEIVALTDHSLVLNRTYNNNGTVYHYRISYSH